MARSLISPELLHAWNGSSVLILSTHGECGPDQPLSGFYFREARFLRTFALRINGEQPWLCEAAAVDPETLAFTLVHPEIQEHGGGGTGQSGDEVGRDAKGLAERSLDIRVVHRAGIADLAIEVDVTNRALEPVRFELACVLSADFADIQEAHSRRREQDAAVRVDASADRVAFTYSHEALPLRTEVELGEGWVPRGEGAAMALSLAPQEQRRGRLRVVPFHPDSLLSAADAEQRAAAVREWREGFTRVEIPGNRLFEDVLSRNVRDFGSFPLLHGEPDEWLALQAGIPAYPAFFGRDAVTAGWQAGYVDGGEALSAALIKLGRLQSDRFDDWRDEQPGRIPYQVRTGPLAMLNINPYSAYYADYASPLMFVISLANLWAWTGDRRHLERHWDAARRILDWARTYGDMDGDGYLEYQTRSSKGTKNQGWKDSGDAIVYDDGRPVSPPIATCELQGYWYIAQELMALLSVTMGAPEDAAHYVQSAAALKERFNRDWWMPEEQFFALALDPGKQQVRAVTSNVGHCIGCGIIDREHLPAVVGRLFAPDLFSGWGVRTLSADHTFYNPLSYHRGSVWAVEQATIIFGLRRFGFDARALELTQALFELALLYPEYRIPECIGGYPRHMPALSERSESNGPGAYPRANAPQLWNATAFPLAMQSMLGLLPLAPMNTLVIDPVLPTWLPEVVVRGLRVGEAKVSLRFWRDGDAVKWDVLHRQGTLHIVRQPPPESFTATWGDRAAGLLESIVP